MHISINITGSKKVGNKYRINWRLFRNGFSDEIPPKELASLLPLDLFQGKKYRVSNVYDINMNPYDGFACEGFAEIEFFD